MYINTSLYNWFMNIYMPRVGVHMCECASKHAISSISFFSLIYSLPSSIPPSLSFLPSCLPLPSPPFGLTSVLCFFVYLIFEIWSSSMGLLSTREGAHGCITTPCMAWVMHTSPAWKHFTNLFPIVQSIRTNCFCMFLWKEDWIQSHRCLGICDVNCLPSLRTFVRNSSLKTLLPLTTGQVIAMKAHILRGTTWLSSTDRWI